MNFLTVLQLVGRDDKIIQVYLDNTLMGILLPSQELLLPDHGTLKLAVGTFSVIFDSALLASKNPQ